MSADEEPTTTAADTHMSDPLSNKRKVSVDGELEKETATPSKRVKLEQQEPDALSTTVDDGQVQEAEPASKQDSSTGDQKVETPEQRREEPKDFSPAPSRDAEPKTSKSPTLSRRPSIPTPPEPRRAPDPAPDRRKNFSNEEKKRGQRLFGRLLSTLSQTTANSQQKKRLEIERRQQERAQQQRAEDDKRRAEKLAKLNHVRKIQQVKLDEQVMKTRHSSMLAQAHSFSTKSEPKLYYLPWKLTPSQEDLRKEQIRTTKEVIEKETEQFRRQKEQRLRDLGVTVGEPEPRKDANSRTADDHQASPSLPSPSKQPVHDTASHHEKDHDDADVMVEAAEDTVIY